MNIVEAYQKGSAVLNAQWCLRRATRIGKWVRVWGNPSVKNMGKLYIGNRVRLDSRIATLELAIGPQGTLYVGEGTFINYGTSIGVTQSVSIGGECNIGTYVIIIDNNFHRLEPERRKEMPESAPVTIEDNVWLGARVIVLPGVTIGTGSVIGAGSVVTQNIPQRALAVGLPARIIREL